MGTLEEGLVLLYYNVMLFVGQFGSVKNVALHKSYVALIFSIQNQPYRISIDNIECREKIIKM